jgi:hypothetical protein
MKTLSKWSDRPRRPAPSRARRRRAAARARVCVSHLMLPGHVTLRDTARAGETIAAYLRRTGSAKRIRIGRNWVWSFPLPTICVRNGQPVLQKAWRRIKIKAGDVIEFRSRPMGGGRGGTGKQVMGLVALVALAAFAPWAGGALFGAGTLLAGLAQAGIMIGGALLINALIAPKPGGQNSQDYEVDQLYSVSAQGNAARLFQPITVQYGRVKSFPDYAIQPWSEFEGNDQYLNVLLSIGIGKHSYENLFVDDTVLWDPVNGVSTAFTGVNVAFYEANAPVTLFPTNVTQADEVSGQTLTTTFVGGYVANVAGSIADAIAVDLVFPAGCFTVDGNGNMQTSSVTVLVEGRPVNDAGAPTGAYAPIDAKTFNLATRNPQRHSIKTAVPPGRWEVQVKRTADAITGTNGSNEVIWAGLRAFIQGPSSFPTATVAIRIKANSQLSQSSAKKFGVLCTRLLNVWDGGTETFVEQACRNPLWAAYNAATDTVYGAKRLASKIDFQTFYDQALAADARGDKFDYRFTAAVPVPQALDTILKVARCRHKWSGDVLTVVRDEWAEIPRMPLTDREIVRGSLSIKYTLNPDDGADAVILEYLDEDTWEPAEVQYPPNSIEFTALNPTRIRLDGIVNRDHGYREAAFFYRQAQYRRREVTLDTEHEGRMLGIGSRVRVQSELPESWGACGVVAGRASNVLTLDPAPTWVVGGTHYIAIRTKTAKQFGPVLCTEGVDAAHAILDPTDLAAVETAQSITLTDVLVRADGAEDPTFDFGVGENKPKHCVVMSGRPSGDKVTLQLVVDKPEVHATDLGTTPAVPAVPALRDPKVPIVAGLHANFRQGVMEPRLDVAWWPAAGALYYRADVSYDGGASWMPVYEGAEPSFSAVVDRAALQVRVQGISISRAGAFSTATVPAPDIQFGDAIVGPDSLTGGLNDYVMTQLADQIEHVNFLAQRIAALATESAATGALDRRSVRTLVEARLATMSAQITETAQIVEDTINNRLEAAYFLTLDVNGYVSGIYAFNDGETSDFAIIADRFRVAWPGQTGGAAVPVFQIANVNGVAKLTLRGDMQADGSILARHVSVSSLSSLTANLGTITTGLIVSPDGLFRIDATNHQVVISQP